MRFEKNVVWKGKKSIRENDHAVLLSPVLDYPETRKMTTKNYFKKTVTMLVVLSKYVRRIVLETYS